MAAVFFRSASLILLLFTAGCAVDPPGPVSLCYWQHSVEQYVWQQGNGDPTVLADMSWDDVHKGFAVISDAQPDQSTDLIGLLLAHRKTEGRLYFLFLVGSVRDRALADLRPVALNVEGGRFHWFVGPSSPEALALYRQALKSDPTVAASVDSEPPPFPAPGDTFSVAVTGNGATILHDPSGASWDLDLPPPVSAQAYSNSSSSPTSRSK